MYKKEILIYLPQINIMKQNLINPKQKLKKIKLKKY